jgi:hypothetical protein
MSVQVWSPGESLTEAIVVCRAVEAAALQAAIAAKGGAIDAYQVVPNGEVYLSQLRGFLAIRADKAWVPTGKHLDSDSAWIIRNFQRLAHGLTHWDDGAALGAVRSLMKNQAALHPQQARFVQFCEPFVTKVIRRLLWGSPLLLAWPPHSSTRLWWQLSGDLAHEVGMQMTDLKNAFHGSIPAALQQLSVWLSQLQGRLNSRLFGAAREDAMLEASALCAALAAIHFSAARYSLATLFSHRAADLLFTSICADEGLIDYRQAGGEGALKSAINGETKLSLMNCHDALEQASVILINGARRTALLDLNSTRNRLFLTHAIGSTPSADTKNALQVVVGLMKGLGGADWESAYKYYREGFVLEPISMFELSEGLMQTLQPL